MLQQQEDRSPPPQRLCLVLIKTTRKQLPTSIWLTVNTPQRSFSTSSVLLLWVELDDVETAHVRWRGSCLVQQLQDDRAHTKPATGSSEIQGGGAAAEGKEQDNVVTLQNGSEMLTK